MPTWGVGTISGALPNFRVGMAPGFSVESAAMWWLRLEELKHYPTENDRRDVVRRWEATRPLPSKGLMIFLAMFVIGPVLAYPMDLLVGILGILVFPLFLFLVVVIGLAMRTLYSELRSKRFRMFVRHDLLSMRICWRCGYDLTGNASGTCSECGLAGIDLGSSLSDSTST